ncbi:MAG: TetR family transcriptional regulator [Solirubrobacteraceae bacterium]|nr:TetR family transcriptional regulator [Solirubrobacteraceae bacterium]
MAADPQDVTVADIADAAVALVEADGVAALTMRRLATALGCSTMVLYGRGTTKDALLRAVAERRLAARPLPDVAGRGWREAITALAGSLYDAYREDPVLAELLTLRPADVAPVRRATELVLQALRSALPRPDDVLAAYEAIAWYTVGATQRHVVAAPEDPRTAFDRGLALVLDGVAARAARSVGAR